MGRIRRRLPFFALSALALGLVPVVAGCASSAKPLTQAERVLDKRTSHLLYATVAYGEPAGAIAFPNDLDYPKTRYNRFLATNENATNYVPYVFAVGDPTAHVTVNYVPTAGGQPALVRYRLHVARAPYRGESADLFYQFRGYRAGAADISGPFAALREERRTLAQIPPSQYHAAFAQAERVAAAESAVLADLSRGLAFDRGYPQALANPSFERGENHAYFTNDPSGGPAVDSEGATVGDFATYEAVCAYLSRQPATALAPLYVVYTMPFDVANYESGRAQRPFSRLVVAVLVG